MMKNKWVMGSVFTISAAISGLSIAASAVNTPFGMVTVNGETNVVYFNGKMPNPTVKGFEALALSNAFNINNKSIILIKQINKSDACQGPFNFITLSAKGAVTSPTFGECVKNIDVSNVNGTINVVYQSSNGVKVKHLFAEDVLTANGNVVKNTRETHFYNHEAVINDPDGYTNMRSGPGAKNSIVTRVDAGDVILTRPQSGEWWKVSLMDRTEGYMHKSRIILLQKYPY